MEILKNLKKSFLNLGETSFKIIKYGTQFAAGVVLIGLITYIVNQQMFIFNHLGEQFGIHIMLAGVSLFVQFIIGGLVFDIVQKRRG